jgi:flagellar basal body-associated protein FliL
VKIIVPAVVVPVVVLLVVAVIAAWAFMHRRQRQQQEVDSSTTPGNNYEGKAQLHADPFRPELDAVATVKGKALSPNESEVAELPARELVGSEMDADGRDS